MPGAACRSAGQTRAPPTLNLGAQALLIDVPERENHAWRHSDDFQLARFQKTAEPWSKLLPY